jgi:hypothetical protein
MFDMQLADFLAAFADVHALDRERATDQKVSVQVSGTAEI